MTRTIFLTVVITTCYTTEKHAVSGSGRQTEGSSFFNLFSAKHCHSLKVPRHHPGLTGNQSRVGPRAALPEGTACCPSFGPWAARTKKNLLIQACSLAPYTHRTLLWCHCPCHRCCKGPRPTALSMDTVRKLSQEGLPLEKAMPKFTINEAPSLTQSLNKSTRLKDNAQGFV